MEDQLQIWAVWENGREDRGKINDVIRAENDKRIRVMSRVKGPKCSHVLPYYRDVKELMDETD